MNLKTILFLPLYLFSILIYSQSYSYNENKEFIVSGKVTNSENSEPLEYATITILDPKDNNVITGGLSDGTGNFRISTKKGIYNVLIEYMSFKNKTLENINVYNDLSLGEVQLELNYESLGEVEIIAEETSVEIRLDNKI